MWFERINELELELDIGDNIKKHDYGRYYKLHGVMFCNDTYTLCRTIC